MSDPFLGEIRMFAGTYAPDMWAFCEGQFLLIAQYGELFSVIGTMYGGDGMTTFALPDLRGRVPIHQGNAFVLAQKGGAEKVTLTANQTAAHSHSMQATSDIPNLSSPKDNLLGQAAAKFYRAGTPTVSLNAASVSAVGGSQPHANLQPYLCINFIISLNGIYPQRP
jgi:microcystin-dependent protein